MDRKLATVRPEVRGIHSPDLEYGDLPDHPDDCSVFIEASIGAKGETGADLFGFEATTLSQLPNKLPRWGKGLLILERFSWHSVETALDQLVRECEGFSWSDCCAQLCKALNWEYENYKP